MELLNVSLCNSMHLRRGDFSKCYVFQLIKYNVIMTTVQSTAAVELIIFTIFLHILWTLSNFTLICVCLRVCHLQ